MNFGLFSGVRRSLPSTIEQGGQANEIAFRPVEDDPRQVRFFVPGSKPANRKFRKYVVFDGTIEAFDAQPFVRSQYGVVNNGYDIVWATRTSNFGTTAIFSVAYGNSLWVAGGVTGQLRTSTDAITWTTRVSNFGTTAIRSVTYGNNLWVAGGDVGQLRTSTDAITWTTQTSNFGTTNIFSVAYGNSLWVAAGFTGQLRTSTDAITWVTQTSNFGTTNIRSVAYGNSLWVAGGSGGPLRTSTDAVTWVTRSGIGASMESFVYGNNLWVAGGYNGVIATSTDATTWVTSVPSGFSGVTTRSIAFGKNIFVAVGGGLTSSSTDGITWVTRALIPAVPRAIVHDNNLWVVGSSDGGIYTSFGPSAFTETRFNTPSGVERFLLP